MYPSSMSVPQGLAAPAPARRILWHHAALLILAHVVFGVYGGDNGLLATAHAMGTLGLGLWWALNRRMAHVAAVGAYIVGAEVLWRMAEAQVFWEYGKYALSFLMLVAIIRAKRVRGPLLPLAYFLLLLPSAGLTLVAYEASMARELISFNLSGPFTVLVCAWFFHRLTFTPEQLQRMLLALVAPVVSIAAAAIFNTVTASEISFASEANFVTSGGFGPNQVAAVLGLGALGCFLYLLYSRIGSLHRMLVGGVMLLLIFQSAFTFSRGGLAMALGSAVTASIFLMRNARYRLTILLLAGFLFVFVEFALVPVLDDITGGAFSHRFGETTTTGRTEIALVEMRVWQEHPVTGVGPGMGSVYRREILGLGIDERVAAHTEYTRMIAEHGLFGILSLVALFLMTRQQLFRERHARKRALIAAFTSWAVLFMLVYGFRLAAPAFMMGVMYLSYSFDRKPGR